MLWQRAAAVTVWTCEFSREVGLLAQYCCGMWCCWVTAYPCHLSSSFPYTYTWHTVIPIRFYHLLLTTTACRLGRTKHIQHYIFKGYNFFSFKLSFSLMTGVDLYDPCNAGCMPWLKQHFQLLVFSIVHTTLHYCHASSYSETVHTLFLNGNSTYISLHYAISVEFLVAKWRISSRRHGTTLVILCSCNWSLLILQSNLSFTEILHREVLVTETRTKHAAPNNPNFAFWFWGKSMLSESLIQCWAFL